MKPILLNSLFIIVATALFFSLVSCNENAIATKKATAAKKAAGSWRLVAITSGWTGKTNPPTEKVEMAIDDQQQAIIYKNGTEVSRYQYTLEEAALETLRFTIIRQSGITPIYLPTGGYIGVSNKQLVIDYTFTDGPAYTFERG